MSPKTLTIATKEEAKPTLVPKLRFPEFRGTGEWDADSLGKVTEFLNEKIALERVALEDYISTENIRPDYGNVDRASKLPTTGSVTRFQSNETLVSNIRPYLKKVWVADREGGASNDVIVIRAKQILLPQYWSFLLKNDAFIDYVMTSAKGVKMPRGDVGSMKAYLALYPSKPEQQKIADCLSSLDELIATLARKVDALKTHKKGLMQQLFPIEGETQPRLRFPEFRDAGEWEAGNLGLKTSKVGSGVTPSGGDTNYKQSGRPFVRSQNVGWGELLLEDVAFIDEKTHSSFNATEIKILDVLLNITGAAIGRSAIADQRITGGNVNQHVCIIRVRPDELDPFFINQYLISPMGQGQTDSFQAGGNRQSLNFTQIRSFSISWPPTIAEQHRIADCLTSLDNLITAATQKLDTLKTLKKGLMQQLFPAAQVVEA